MFKESQIKVVSDLLMKVKCLHTNNGEEYTTMEFAKYLNECKIRRKLACPHTPQQNGVVERKNRHLAEAFISMLHASNVLER